MLVALSIFCYLCYLMFDLQQQGMFKSDAFIHSRSPPVFLKKGKQCNCVTGNMETTSLYPPKSSNFLRPLVSLGIKLTSLLFPNNGQPGREILRTEELGIRLL